MKNIFKKNQIIITALAIMIIIAGYLNFVDKKDKDLAVDSALDYDNTYVNEDMTDGDMVSVEGSDLVADDETNSDADVADVTKPDTDVADAAKPDTEVTDGTDAVAGDETEDVADIADEDLQLPVADNGEVIVNDENTETSAPGEAILVSTTLNENYFASAKLTREQVRAVNKESFVGIIDNVNLTEEAKALAVTALLNLTTMVENENETETLLEAKGYSDAMVSISEDSVDVIVNAVSITEQDVAKIEDIVKRKTGATSSEIHISPVVLGE